MFSSFIFPFCNLLAKDSIVSLSTWVLFSTFLKKPSEKDIFPPYDLLYVFFFCLISHFKLSAFILFLTNFSFLLNPNDNEVIDHINGDVTDNRRKNLRIVTQQQNLINKAILSNNTSEIAGVSWDKSRNKWTVEIRLNNIKCYLGRYEKKEDAVFVRYYAELKLFKEFRSNRNDQNILKLF